MVLIDSKLNIIQMSSLRHSREQLVHLACRLYLAGYS